MLEKYLIWSHEHGAWWRAKRYGYTVRMEEAGRYDRQEAIKICATRDTREDGTWPELPVREDDAISMLLPYRQTA